MHFHLPKPLHGWREFVGEVGIITLGVLIALGAEQIVEAWQWHEKVGIVRKSLMGELANDRARWEHDMSAIRCAQHDAERLDSWASQDGTGLPPTSTVRSSSLYAMHSTNWTLAASSQTLDHFPMREQLAFAALYAGLANRQIDILKASDSLEQIQTLLPLASDAQGRRELRKTLGELRAAISSLLDNEGYMTRHFDALAVKADRSDFAADITATDCKS